MTKGPYPKTVILVRHAESEGNLLSPAERAAVPIGTASYNLTPRGVRQGELTGEWLRERYPLPDRIIRSYYARTAQTAELCYPGMSIRADERLIETDRGMYTVLGDQGMHEKMPWEIERRRRLGIFFYIPPGGENSPMVIARVRAFRNSLRANYPNKVVVCVTHANWLMHWQMVQHRWTIEEYERVYLAGGWVANASVLIYHGAYDRVRKRYFLRHDPATDYVIPWEGMLER